MLLSCCLPLDRHPATDCFPIWNLAGCSHHIRCWSCVRNAPEVWNGSWSMCSEVFCCFSRTTVFWSEILLAAVITSTADHMSGMFQRYETVPGRCVLESYAASHVQQLSSDLKSCWLQSSHILLMVSGMLQRYITLVGCHFLMCSAWSLLLFQAVVESFNSRRSGGSAVRKLPIVQSLAQSQVKVLCTRQVKVVQQANHVAQPWAQAQVEKSLQARWVFPSLSRVWKMSWFDSGWLAHDHTHCWWKCWSQCSTFNNVNHLLPRMNDQSLLHHWQLVNPRVRYFQITQNGGRIIKAQLNMQRFYLCVTPLSSLLPILQSLLEVPLSEWPFPILVCLYLQREQTWFPHIIHKKAKTLRWKDS